MTHASESNHQSPSRRGFLKASIKTAAVIGFPSIVPASVFGADAPSNPINIGAIGVGRISRVHDLPGIWQFDQARIMAVCDLDTHRVEQGKALVNDYYAKKTGKLYGGVTGYHNYHDLLANKDIDAVVISARACSTCLIHHIAMKSKRHLHWDPVKERFKDDDQANAMLSRPQRSPYLLNA